MGDNIVAGGGSEVKEPEVKKSKMAWVLRRGRGDTELGEQEAEAKPIAEEER